MGKIADDSDYEWAKIVAARDRYRDSTGWPIDPWRYPPNPAKAPAPAKRTIPINVKPQPTELVFELAVRASWEITDEDWSELQGTPLYSDMFVNRVQIQFTEPKPTTRTSDPTAAFREVILDWLNNNCTNFFHTDYNSDVRGRFAVYFLSKADSVNFGVYWAGNSIRIPI